jgi:hypothetical protein
MVDEEDPKVSVSKVVAYMRGLETILARVIQQEVGEERKYFEARRGIYSGMADDIERLFGGGRKRALKVPFDKVAAMWVLDRADQYNNGSGSKVALENIVGQLARGEHIISWEHGELAGLEDRILRIAGGKRERG